MLPVRQDPDQCVVMFKNPMPHDHLSPGLFFLSVMGFQGKRT